jgi:hypothetical protein
MQSWWPALLSSRLTVTIVRISSDLLSSIVLEAYRPWAIHDLIEEGNR